MVKEHPWDKQRYFILDGQQETGPYSLMQIREMWSKGHINSGHYFFSKGMLDWAPIGRLKNSVLNIPEDFIPIMALCIDCGKEMSFRAPFCPVCGYPKSE